jgi:hypothetical protein
MFRFRLELKFDEAVIRTLSPYTGTIFGFYSSIASLPERFVIDWNSSEAVVRSLFLYTRTTFGLYVAENRQFGKTTAADGI